MMTIDDWKAGKRRALWLPLGRELRGEPGISCRVVSFAKIGARVRWADGRIDRVHPEDLYA